MTARRVFIVALVAGGCAAGAQVGDAAGTGGSVGAGGQGGAAGTASNGNAAGHDAGAAAGSTGLAGTGGSAPRPDASTPVDLLPPAGTTWLFIGQDVQTIDAYAAAVGPPGGLVGYTSLQTLGGIDQAEDNGAGMNFMRSLVGRYPRVPVAIGLYLVGVLDAVNTGSMDSRIETLAVKLEALGRPVLLRIGYEFDNPGNGYNPAAFRTAFARIATRLRQTAPSGIAMVWQSAAICGSPGGSLSSFYPGDDVVDWVGLSYFRQASCNYAPVKSVVEFARGKGKPVLIAEGAPQGYDLARGTYSNDGAAFMPRTAAQAWSEWFAPMLSFVAANADVIRGVTYIDANWNTQPMWSPPYTNGYFGDSRVQAEATILSSWRTALADPRWATY